jgi:hypothetical protein
MKKLGFWLCTLLASIASLSAQVTVEVVLDQEQFLPGEAVATAVRISNLSGQKLHLGAEDDWLTFSLESREGTVVPKLGDVPVAGEFSLESSRVATKRVDLAPWFALTQPGRYKIIATMKIKEWGQEISSRPAWLNVMEGAHLWEQSFGLPIPPGATNAAPEIRKYILQQANNIRGRLRLYLRVMDEAGTKAYRVLPIGPMLSFSRPEAQVDQMSDLHVLFQSGPHSFSYHVFNPDGEPLVHQTYIYEATRPRLHASGDGKVSVLGGVRQVTSMDLPAPKPSPPSEQPPKSASPPDEPKPQPQ